MTFQKLIFEKIGRHCHRVGIDGLRSEIEIVVFVDRDHPFPKRLLAMFRIRGRVDEVQQFPVVDTERASRFMTLRDFGKERVGIQELVEIDRVVIHQLRGESGLP